MRIIDHLMTHLLKDRFEDLFATSSPHDLLLQIREVSFIFSWQIAQFIDTHDSRIGPRYWR